MIKIKELSCTLGNATVLNNINIDFNTNEICAVIGVNGSGKSTLSRHLNGLYLPDYGEVLVDGIKTTSKKELYKIRRKVGMVFQDPASQAVATVVDDDIAFAPENFGLSEDETAQRVEFAMEAAGITHLRGRIIKSLSGGEKQAVAIASVLAMKPDYIVFDEATSMLDPLSKTRIFNCAANLKNMLGTGIIWITQNMEEAALCDRVVVINKGIIKADGTPQNIFYNNRLIEECRLDVPKSVSLANSLKERGFDIGTPITLEDVTKNILKGVKNTDD